MTRTVEDIIRDYAYHELRTWRVVCVICGVDHVTQAPAKPTELPEGWDVRSYGIACQRCVEIADREGES